MECDIASEIEQAFDEMEGEIILTLSEQVRTILNQHKSVGKILGKLKRNPQGIIFHPLSRTVSGRSFRIQMSLRDN